MTAARTHVKRQSFELMSPGPLFVVGMWRSGTSLLYALLNQHPQIGLMYESDLPLLSSLFLLRRKSSSWAAKFDSWNGALTRHNIDARSIPGNIVDLPNAFRAIAQQYARKKGATIWGCKSPNYYDCMNQLADWCPNAKFIVIWRDPAEVCRSIVRAAKKAAWFARPGMDLRALLGCHRMKKEADSLVRRGVAIHQLQYDDLVHDPTTALAKICDFVGIDYDPRMTSLEGADRSAIYDGDHHAMVKSSSIVAHGERPEVLSAKFKQKIERYIAFWLRQYNGSWPANPKISEGTQPAPLFERACDRGLHSLLRAVDLAIPIAYSLVPLPIWLKYRQWKHRSQPISTKGTEPEVV